MLARTLERIVVAQDAWARPLGEWVHRLVAAVFGPVRPLRDFLAGTWLGHPVHPMLTDVPIGAMTIVIVLDLVGQRTGADIALVVGILAMLGAAAAGYADYATTDGKARTRATTHSTLMVISLLVYVVSLGLRAGAPADRTVPIALSIVAFLILAGGAFVGGDVVYLLGNVVDRHAWRPTGAKWQPLEVGDIPEATPVQARLGMQTLVLVRSGETIHALHDQCAHAGGPLSGGRIVNDCLECPYHGSLFEISSGRRRRGPAVYDQPRYEVRPTATGGYEARRVS